MWMIVIGEKLLITPWGGTVANVLQIYIFHIGDGSLLYISQNLWDMVTW